MGVTGGHAVEEEGVDVVVEGFVVEEELTEEAEVAAPGALAAAVDLEEGHVVVAVDLIAGRVVQRAFFSVAAELSVVVEVEEAHFADVDHFGVGEFGWVGTEIPGFDLVLAHLNAFQVADSADFGLVLGH